MTHTIASTVNLVARDLSRFDLFPQLLHYIWIGPLQIILITYILYEAFGVKVFSAMSVFVLVIHINGNESIK